MQPTRIPHTFLEKLRYRLWEAPRGFGRPVDTGAMDREYASGAWDHFHGLTELSRRMAAVGFVTHLHPRAKVVDFGCGSGGIAALISHFPIECYTGVDVSKEGLSRARALALPKCRYFEGDFNTWRPEAPVDVLLFSECLNYAWDAEQLLRDLSPHLLPGGHFVISMFRFGNSDAIWRRVERVTKEVERAVVSNRNGQTWEIRLLEPLG